MMEERPRSSSVPAVPGDAVPSSPRMVRRGRAATIAGSLVPELRSLLTEEQLEEHSKPEHRVCCCWMSGTALSLLTMAGLFSLITAVQFVFGTIANSMALQADCLSMGIDALTYLLSLLVECWPTTEPGRKQEIELGMAGLSYCILLGLTLWFISEAAEAFQSNDDEEEVNGWIVFGFAAGGILFDAVSLLVAVKCQDQAATDEPAEESGGGCGMNANLYAAVGHVLSDTLRSFTTLVLSIMLLCSSGEDGGKLDCVATLIVCSVIVIGTLWAMYGWAVAVSDGRCAVQNCFKPAVAGADVEMPSSVEPTKVPTSETLDKPPERDDTVQTDSSDEDVAEAPARIADKAGCEGPAAATQ